MDNNEIVEDMDEPDEGVEVILPSGLRIYSRVPTRETVRALMPPEYLEWASTHTREEAGEDKSAENIIAWIEFLNKAIVAFWIDPRGIHGVSTEAEIGTEDITAKDKLAYFDWVYSFVPVFVPSSGIEA